MFMCWRLASMSAEASILQTTRAAECRLGGGARRRFIAFAGTWACCRFRRMSGMLQLDKAAAGERLDRPCCDVGGLVSCT
ncbi:uncharacterized protein IWZ02DRAFT_447973 [Phyllosticta citriasiana]|uniref:uncharacterized protein n=1 Tax=Phyllosticta citriasiana TaxID=595635 RepID=UPI0030FD3C5A